MFLCEICLRTNGVSTILVLSEGDFSKALSPALHSEVAVLKGFGLISTKVLMKHKRQHTHTYIHTKRNSFSCTASSQQIGCISFYQIANICWIIERAREFQKNIYFSFIDYTKAFDYVDHIKLWKTLKDIGIPDHITCLLLKKEQLESDMK